MSGVRGPVPGECYGISMLRFVAGVVVVATAFCVALLALLASVSPAFRGIIGRGRLRAVLCTLVASLALAGPPRAHAFVYWGNDNANNAPGATSIGRANLNGTGVNQNFITGGTRASMPAVDGSFVYWANYADGTIGRANLDATGVNQSFISGADGPFGSLSIAATCTGPTAAARSPEAAQLAPALRSRGQPRRHWR